MFSPTLALSLYHALISDDPEDFADALGIDPAAIPELDYETELDTVFDDGSWLLTAFDNGPSSVSPSQIVFGSGSDTFTASLSGLAGSLSELQVLATLASSTGAEYFTGFTLVDDGTTLMSATVGASSTTVTSGTQSATFTGSLTGSASDAIDVLTLMPGIFDELFGGFEEEEEEEEEGGGGGGGAGGGGGGEEEEESGPADYLEMLAETGFTAMTLYDDGVEFGAVSVSDSTLTLSYMGATFTVSGNFTNATDGEKFRLLAGAVDIDFEELDSLTGVTITGMTITDSNSDTVFSFSGSFTAASDFDGARVAVTGTTGDDTEIPDIIEAIMNDGLDEGDMDRVTLALGNGQDEAAVSAYWRLFNSETYGAVYPDLHIHGGGHADTLDFQDLEDPSGPTYEREFTFNWGAGTIQTMASFSGGALQAMDLGVTFASIDRLLIATHGDVTVTGNTYNNTLAFEEFSGELTFDGGGGTDTLDFQDLVGGPNYGDGSTPAMFDGDMTFSDFKSVARVVKTGASSYALFDKASGDQFGTLTDVETIVFDDGADGSESFDIGRLLETDLMDDLDGVLGGDFLIRETSHVGGHHIHSGEDGSQGDFLRRATEAAVATDDFTGDGIADILFKHSTQNRHTLVDGSDGSTTNVGRVYQSFLTSLDIDGDGTHELLFRKINGDLEVTSVDRLYTYEARYSRPADTVKGIGDFDGDGDDDIAVLMSNNLMAWIDTDDGRLISFNRGVNPTAVGIGDTNGDGTDEIIFQRGNGSKFSADKDGIVTEFGLNNWTLTAVGDFNGDGAEDLLVKNGSVYTAVNGETKALLQTFAQADDFLGVINLGHDMTDELLFSDSSAGLQVWEVGTGFTDVWGLSGDSIYLDQPTGLVGYDYELI